MAPDASSTQPLRVLIVDDEPEIRRVLTTLLTRSSTLNAMVQECPDGETALELLARQRFDIIISDYRMRQRTGIDVLERAADLYPESGRVLITGYAEIDIAVDAVNRGRVSGFVRKPWDSKNLLTLIESLVPGGAGHVARPPSAATAPAGLRAPPPAAPPAVPPAVPPTAPANVAPQPARGIAQPTTRHVSPSGMSIRNPQRELEEIEHQMRQLRVKFGIGSLSAEGYRKLSEELRQRRADLEFEIFGKQRF